MGLAEATYRLTQRFPNEEKFGLTSQASRGGFDPRQHRRRLWARHPSRLHQLRPHRSRLA